MALTLATNTNDDIPGVAPYDLYLDGNNNIAMVYNQQALLEACAQAARLFFGELVLNTDVGNPYLETIFSGVTNIPLFNSALIKSFLAVGGGGLVTNVTELNTQVSKGIMTYTATIQTIYSTSTITGAITNV